MKRIGLRLNSLIIFCIAHLVFAGLLFESSVYAAEVDSTTAKTVARNFYQSHIAQNSMMNTAMKHLETELALSHIEYMDMQKKASKNPSTLYKPLYYLFEIGDEQGFIIVSGDDRIIPILGYSLTGGFYNENQPPAFIEWMLHYAEQISYLIENEIETDLSIKEDWNSLRNNSFTKSAQQVSDVAPLLTTIWDQGCYYNDLCPDDSSGPCGQAWAGCVAVAMSQIMKYWNFPATGKQIPGYYAGPDYGCLPDIASSSYDWTNMPDALNSNSGSNEIQAVAELLYHTGVSVSMEYGPDGSGAWSDDVRNALVSYFNYSSSTQHIYKYSMSDESWAQSIINELDNQRPVYYSGQGSIGHAFVCDGYQGSDYFHFNWGWSGVHNGYFYLSDLTPGGESFNNFQSAIIGIAPDQENKPDPMEHIIEIEGTGAANSLIFTSGGEGGWEQNTCQTPTPGAEQLYRFLAPITGYYSIEAVSASGRLVYGWRKESCALPGWECIGNISTEGTHGNMPLTAGTTYYILLDDVDLVSNAHQFYINEPLPGSPVIEYFRHTIDDDTQDASSGDNDGLAEAGETIELSIILMNTGDFDTHNVSAVLSSSDPDISIVSANSNYGDISVGTSERSEQAYVIIISPECPEKEVSFTLEITSDEENWTEEFSMDVLIDIPPSPVLEYYSHRIDDDTPSGDGDGIPEQGESILMSLSLNNSGDQDAHNVSAVLNTTDPHISIVTSTGIFGDILRNNYMQSTEDYSFDISADCPEKDVTFTLDITSEEGSWTDQFVVHVNLYSPPAPELIYFSHNIDDKTSSGDGDGLVEAGETINIPITLSNTGDAAAHNVSAVLSAADADISLVTQLNDFQDIAAGGNAQSSGNYVFEVAEDCREKDVAFTLEITSDEDSWTDQFLLHVYHGPNSISDEPFNSAIEIYPIPAHNAVFLKSAMEIDSQFEIRIMDSRGATVFVKDFPSFIREEIIEIDLSEFYPGIYFIQLRHSDLSLSRKIIVE